MLPIENCSAPNKTAPNESDNLELCDSVPLLDMSRQSEKIADEIERAIGEVCRSGKFVLGPECQKFEEDAAAYCQVKHAIGCASGSDALLLALMAMEIGPGDEVILPSYTFFATAGAVWRVGAKPVFVDIYPDSFNLNLEDVQRHITPQTKAIIPVHLFGQCADVGPTVALAKKHDLLVIEDAAQAIGAELNGRRAGSLCDVGCFSFYPTKNLGAFGDGGMLTTNCDDLAARLRLLRVHGMEPRYYHKIFGVNSRLDSIQAAVLRVKLPHLDCWTQGRTNNANRYAELFSQYGLENQVTLPVTLPGRRHTWNQYVIRVSDERRDALRASLAAANIGTEIYYPVPVHQQECFAELLAGQTPLPETERAARETIALPIFPELTSIEVRTVVAKIAEFFAAGEKQSPQAA